MFISPCRWNFGHADYMPHKGVSSVWLKLHSLLKPELWSHDFIAITPRSTLTQINIICSGSTIDYTLFDIYKPIWIFR